MSHVTFMRHVVMCHDVSLARECLATVAIIFWFMSQVRIHILGLHSRFMI